MVGVRVQEGVFPGDVSQQCPTARLLRQCIIGTRTTDTVYVFYPPLLVISYGHKEHRWDEVAIECSERELMKLHRHSSRGHEGVL